MLQSAVVCPACGSPALRPWGRDSDKPILMCAKCGSTCFARPIVHSHDYGTYYPYLKDFDRERHEWELDRRRRGFNFQLEEIERLDPPGRTLVDVGAGLGYFCAIAQERGWTTTAVEVSHDAVMAGTRELGVHFGDLMSLADGSCSVITAFHVLEHLEAPGDLVRLFRSKLAPGGLLVVHVPNVESLTSYLQYWRRRLLRGSDERKGSLYYPEHVTGFTPAGLAACVTSGGFELIRLRQRSYFSRYHWPVSLKEYLLSDAPRWKAVAQFALQSMWGLFDNVGQPFGKGDWIVGHFRARG